MTGILKELICLGKKNSENSNLAFSTDFADLLRYNFPIKLSRQLRRCKGEGQEKFENMLNKIEEFRENAEQDLKALGMTLDGVDKIALMDDLANSKTESMAEASLIEAEKDDVFELFDQQIKMKLKEKVGLDDSNAYKTVADDENEQLDDVKATLADVHSLFDTPVSCSEPLRDLTARHSNMKEIDNNPGEKSKDQKEWEMEEPAESLGDVNGGLNDNNEEENPDEDVKADAEDLSYPSCSTCASTDVNSVASAKKPEMFSEDALHLSEETFKENSNEILEIHEHFPDDKVANKEVIQLKVYDFGPEYHEGNLKKIRDEIGEGKKNESF